MAVLDLAFIVDPLAGLKAWKDTSVATMREAARRGHRIFAIEPGGLALASGRVRGAAIHIDPTAADGTWYRELGRDSRPLAEFAAVLMRKDPPFDIEYIAATWLLERAEVDGARVINRPRALRDHSEKLSIAEFPRFTVPMLVARAPEEIHAFIDAERDVILKPLDGMGGSAIFRVRADDPNRNVIVETLGAEGGRTIMVQRFIPEIAAGDKRILLIDGEPVPFALARVPKPGETRGNLAAGGTGTAQPLSARDREIAETVGAALAPRGLMLIGLDVIGDWLTEINVTSPTCFVEIETQTGFAVAASFVDAIERACA
jgi:glutathione synthase